MVGEAGMKEYIVQARAQETIDSFDAYNAPEIIRCKNCKYYDGNGTCMKNGIAFLTDNWFCADGERKDDDA